MNDRVIKVPDIFGNEVEDILKKWDLVYEREGNIFRVPAQSQDLMLGVGIDFGTLRTTYKYAQAALLQKKENKSKG